MTVERVVDRCVLRIVAKAAAVVVVAAVGAGLVVSHPGRRADVTTTPRPQRIVAVDRFGSIFELNGSGHRTRELLHTRTLPGERIALLSDGRVAYSGCCNGETVRVIGTSRPLATGVDFWGISPDGRWLATSTSRSTIVTVIDLRTHARHTIDLTEVSKTMLLTLENWTPDSRHLLFAYPRTTDDQPRAGFIYTVDAQTGTITRKTPVADVTRIGGAVALADGRVLVIDLKLVGTKMPAADEVDAIAPNGTRTFVARFSPAAAQLHVDATGTHVLVVGTGGIQWLEPNGSTGLIAPTPPTDDFWWAAW